MKVICDRAGLLDAVNLVAAVVPVRSPSPQLSCVRLEASKGKAGSDLHLTGTDAETSLQFSLAQCDAQKAGLVVVPAEKLRQIIQATDTDPTLTLESDSDACLITGANSRFKVFGYPASDFPKTLPFAEALAQDKPRTTFVHSAGGLLGLIHRTSFATARESSRYAINGVLLRRDGKKLEMAATDGRRLALARTTVKSAASTESSPSSCIIPSKALNLFTRLALDPEEGVRVAITERRVYFAFGVDITGKDEARAPRAVLSSALVEGTFPPYEDVIPKDQDKKAVIARDAFAGAVRRAAILTNEESRGVRMAFSGKSKRLKISSRAPEMGEAEIEVDLTSFDGDDIEISFNPAFIVDALKVMDQEQVTFELKASNKPGLMRSESDFVYVVMPVNLPT
ncbi:MAG: DNA polymerase III subunit beta [Phycisphaerae bacterium]|nr:DNA polymerase III subunit beta [Phycisphaerae bacterium]